MNSPLFSNTEEGREAFRALSLKVVDWIIQYYGKIASLPVRSQVQPGGVYRQLDMPLSPDPVPDEVVFRILDEVIVPGMTHWQHPNFYAFFPGNTSFPSIAAEMISAGLSAQCMMWETSPAAAELEQRCMEWGRDLLGLPSAWEGVIQDTASTSTLTALLTAREWKSGFRIAKRGFDQTTFRLYASAQAHSSVEKAVRLAGFGTDNLVLIETNELLAMKPDVLEQAVRADLAKGYVPVCVVSTLGTTSTGAIDPIAAISRVAAQYGLWHHVDAAYLGPVLMLEEYRNLRDGLDGADSFVYNPHKWMFVQFDCSAYYVKDPALLTRTMGIQPSYLKTLYGDQVRDYRDWGIPLGRRFRALKWWMTMALLGTDAIKQKIRQHIAFAALVESWIRSDPEFELVYPRSVSILCFRYEITRDADGSRTRNLCAAINNSGKAYMTHAVVEGHSLIRWVISQTNTTELHLRQTWEFIQKIK